MIYVFDNFEVDLDRLQVRKNGKPIELTKSEFKILLALVETPEECCSRGELMDRVEKGFVQERVVDQHIFNLRKHFKEENSTSRLCRAAAIASRQKVTTKGTLTFAGLMTLLPESLRFALCNACLTAPLRARQVLHPGEGPIPSTRPAEFHHR